MALKKPLSITHPELALEADGWDPTSFSYGSNKKMKWKCQKNHSFEAIINSRAIRGDSCPYCSGGRTLKGFNDLGTTHPDLAMQALNWDPTEYSAGSNKKFDWKCLKGHVWKSTILNRAYSGTGCPICSNSAVQAGVNDLATTHPEVAKRALGWDPLKYTFGSGKRLNWKCPSGHKWNTTIQSQVRNNGCPVCSNHKIIAGINDFATTHPMYLKEVHGWDPSKVGAGSAKKVEWICAKGHVWSVSPESRFRGSKVSGCPICSNNRLLPGTNDLASSFPEIALEASGWDPKLVIPGSNKKLEWVCRLGHRWIASPEQRTGKRKSGCPYCSNKKLLVGFNDLATRFPEIAAESDGWDPTAVISGHSKRRWRCLKGHRWTAEISSRTSTGTGCPSCAKYGFSPDQDGYLYFLGHEYWQMLQIGITNNLNDRLSDHKQLGWEILEVRGPMDGLLAQSWETSILRMLKAKGADLANSEIAGKFDGYSEAWSKSKLSVESISELMALTENHELDKRANE